MVFANCLPVQAVAGDLFRQYPFAPCLVYIRIEQGKRIDAQAFHPPTVDLHFANVKGFSGYNGVPDQQFRLFPRVRVVRFPSHVDGQRIQPGFLPGDGLDQSGRRFLRFRAAEWHEQGKHQSQEHFFHGVYPLGF